MMQNNENENMIPESGFISAQAGGNCFWVEDCTQPGFSCFPDYEDCINSGPWICVENCSQPQGCSCLPGECMDYEFVPCGSGGLVSYESCICADCTKNCGGPLQPPCPRCGGVGQPPCPQNPPGPCQGRAAFPNQGPPPAAAEGAANLKRQLTCQNVVSMYAHGMAKRSADKKKECPNGKVKPKKTGNFYASCGNCFEDVEIVCCAKDKCKTLAEAKAENPCDNVKYLVQNGKTVRDDCGCPFFDFDPKNANINCPDCKEPAPNTGCRPSGNGWTWVNPYCVPKKVKIICGPCENRIAGCINGEWVERCDPKTLEGEATRLGIVCPDPKSCYYLEGGCSPDLLQWTAPQCVWDDVFCPSSSSSSSDSSSSSSTTPTPTPTETPTPTPTETPTETPTPTPTETPTPTPTPTPTETPTPTPTETPTPTPTETPTPTPTPTPTETPTPTPTPTSSSSSQIRWSCTGPNSCTADSNGAYDNETACLDGAPFDCGSSSSSSSAQSSSSSEDCPPGYRKIQTFWSPSNVFSDDPNPLP
jgi:hypothetical protein